MVFACANWDELLVRLVRIVRIDGALSRHIGVDACEQGVEEEYAVEEHGAAERFDLQGFRDRL
jgi:hypothetical protein